MRGNVEYGGRPVNRDYSTCYNRLYISLYRRILESDRANAYKNCSYATYANYIASRSVLRATELMSRGNGHGKCNIGPLSASNASLECQEDRGSKYALLIYVMVR